ncbi:MAG: transporter substrate-binding domain-containing protein [Alphaproteobacteria bacterium]|nr:transporter substrate-binding domain-containing protein [Alphaproteobacteria bacterium]
MKRLLLICFMILFVATGVMASNLVKKESYLSTTLNVVGLPDFPPFSEYIKNDRDAYILKSAFLQPLIHAAQRNDIKMKTADLKDTPDLKMLLLGMKSGDYHVFIGTYSDTKMFAGLEILYPAVISNPVHLITLPETQEQIKTYADLKNLRGIASKSEYFSDFVLRKFKELNITYVDNSLEAYEKLIIGEADYMMGGLYYNKIAASQYGVSDFIAYSKKPLFKIPLFLSLSKETPVLSEYVRILKQELSKPEFATEVKNEIIRLVGEEIEKNDGTVPPSFATIMREKAQSQQDSAVEESPFEEDKPQQNNAIRHGRIVEHEQHQTTFDEALDGI